MSPNQKYNKHTPNHLKNPILLNPNITQESKPQKEHINNKTKQTLDLRKKLPHNLYTSYNIITIKHLN